MYFLQAINSDISVLIVCNKTGGTIKGDAYNKKKLFADDSSIKFSVLIQYPLFFYFINL